MLDELTVSNLGVIRTAHIEPSPGLTVITGETGAGKTLLLGALRLLLGGVASDNLVGPHAEEARAEGRFLTGDGEVAASRRLTRGGRSRAYLDGSIASAAALEEATGGQVEIIGQHDHIELTRSGSVRTVIDRSLDAPGRAAIIEYQQAWGELVALQVDQERLGGDRIALERERELTNHQIMDIARAGFSEGEDSQLASNLARLRNADVLKAHMAEAAAALDKSRDAVGEAVNALRRAAIIDASSSATVGELEAVEDQLGELTIAVTAERNDLETDPDQLSAAEMRWQTLTDLRRRYGPDLSDVLEFGRHATARLAELERILDRADDLEASLEESRLRVQRAGDVLRASRKRAGALLVDRAVSHLRELGLSDPVIEAVVEPAEPSSSGADRSRLLFASDRRIIVGDIARVASGGELSRLVLALRLAGGAADHETLVFDEIDAGVGGGVALAMGQKLAALATERQILCVSHLPQIAAFADAHYVVDREGAEASVRPVHGESRLAELARMLAGLPDSERGREAADELLSLAAATP